MTKGEKVKGFPKKGRVCDLCKKKGHYMRECHYLEVGQKAVAAHIGETNPRQVLVTLHEEWSDEDDLF